VSTSNPAPTSVGDTVTVAMLAAFSDAFNRHDADALMAFSLRHDAHSPLRAELGPVRGSRLPA
jgi:hypothetical protein